jgi:hypothetical protein
MSRILIFDQYGAALGEIDALTRRSWILYGEGACAFRMATSDAKCTETLLQFGNFLLIQDDEFPDWCGVIEPDRNWGHGWMEVRAYTLERMLANCGTPIQKITGSAGTIFEKIVNIYNQYASLPFGFGTIYRGGPQREETLGDSAYEHVRRVRERSGNYWRFTPAIQNGRLTITAEWLETLGAVNGQILAEGLNLALEEPLLTEYGPIWNVVTGLGDASTDGSRLSVTVTDADSAAKYGRRSTSIVFSGNTQLPTLEQNANEYLQQYAQPLKQVTTKIVRNADVFQNLRIGDWYPVSLSSVGFAGGGLGYNAVMRLMGMERDDESDMVDAVMSMDTGGER